MVRTQTVNGSGSQWSYSFTNLPEYDGDGDAISNTVREVPVEGYTTTTSGYTITNTLIPKQPREYVELSGEKTWKDDNNSVGKRPTSITVRLLRDGEVIETRNVTAGTDWKYTFGRLPADDGYGHTYTYTLHEDGVEGYYSQIDGMNVTNGLVSGDVPNIPPEDGETPPPSVPQKPEDIPERNTGTPVPHFEEMSDEMLEDLFDMFGYGTPLYGVMDTGDTVPAWVWTCAGGGLLALALAIILGKRRKRTN